MRELIQIERAEFEGRNEIEERIKACQSIHTPYSWYREDMQRVLGLLDVLFTSAKSVVILESDPVLSEEVNEEIERRANRLNNIIRKLKNE